MYLYMYVCLVAWCNSNPMTASGAHPPELPPQTNCWPEAPWAGGGLAGGFWGGGGAGGGAGEGRQGGQFPGGGGVLRTVGYAAQV